MTTVAANFATGAIGAGQKNMMAGGIYPNIPMATIVRPQDHKVINIAQFAVGSYNEQAETDLDFINVDFGFSWNHHGCLYYVLAIKTKDDDGTYRNAALVRITHQSNGHPFDLVWYNNNNN